MPFFSLTVHFVVRTAGTLVVLLTPGPVRWKLWIDERSRMMTTYLPAFTVFLFMVIVKPGPSVPISVFVRAAASDGTARARDATIAIRASLTVHMGFLPSYRFSCRAARPLRVESGGQLRIRLAEGESSERCRRRLYKAAGTGPDERTATGGDQDVLLAVDR